MKREKSAEEDSGDEAVPLNKFRQFYHARARRELAEFMRYLNTNLSLEINRLYDRRGAVWGSRYKAILVSQEEAAQAGLVYSRRKEGLTFRGTRAYTFQVLAFKKFAVRSGRECSNSSQLMRGTTRPG